jgi:hypothetical protein
MLDPLTALSTASAVVQLVDFGMRILADAQELYTEGNLVTLKEVKTMTEDLVHVNHLLVHRPEPHGNQENPLSDAEKVCLPYRPNDTKKRSSVALGTG